MPCAARSACRLAAAASRCSAVPLSSARVRSARSAASSCASLCWTRLSSASAAVSRDPSSCADEPALFSCSRSSCARAASTCTASSLRAKSVSCAEERGRDGRGRKSERGPRAARLAGSCSLAARPQPARTTTFGLHALHASCSACAWQLCFNTRERRQRTCVCSAYWRCPASLAARCAAAASDAIRASAPLRAAPRSALSTLSLAMRSASSSRIRCS
eukprot:scaffold24559_cov101-Isochrysis_galbana.AAC.5